MESDTGHREVIGLPIYIGRTQCSSITRASTCSPVAVGPQKSQRERVSGHDYGRLLNFVRSVVQTLFPEIHGVEESSSQSGVPHPDWNDGLKIQQKEFGYPKSPFWSTSGKHRIQLGAVLCPPPDCDVICYANGTLVLPGGNSCEEALPKIEVAVSAILGGGWRFRSHFAVPAWRIEGRAAALGRRLLNLGGPDTRVRCLYENTVLVVALYGALVWADTLAAHRRGQARMLYAFHPIATWMAGAYRTVLHAVATVKASFPAMEIVAANK
ncbi:hypothetical protein KM043_018237 [Ampulex compressa]|nr:hypothetical protein KM043_018237 [Ampulex compressa]